MRNAVQRRNHRERAQPQERQKWGLLEKPKDYKLRAADHKVKKRKLKALQQKAADRNEDEFHFGMMSARSQGGVKVAKRGAENSGGGGRVLSGEVVKLMKTQDVGYLRTVLQQTRRERERVEKEVISGDIGVRTNMPGPGTQKLMLTDQEENVSSILKPRNAKYDDDIDTRESDDETATEEDTEQEALSPEGQRKRHSRDVRRRKLKALKDREKNLSAALEEVEIQRAKMNGSVGGVNKNGIKFKVQQRKR